MGTLLIIFIFKSPCINAQQSKIDSLNNLVYLTDDDTVKILLYENLGQAYRDAKKIDSSILSYRQASELNVRSNYSQQHQIWNTAALDYILFEMGNYTESLNYATQELALGEKLKDTLAIAYSFAVFGHNYKALGEYRLALNNYFKARQVFSLYFQQRNLPESDPYIIQLIGDVYLKMNLIDSALIFTRLSLMQAGISEQNKLYSTRSLGDIYFTEGDDQKAIAYYRTFIRDFIKYNVPPYAGSKQNSRDLGFVFNNMSRIFQKMGQTDSAFYYAESALSNAQEYHDEQNIYDAAYTLYQLNENQHNVIQALNYFKMAVVAKDSMVSSEKLKQIQILSFNNELRQKEQHEADAKESAKESRIIIISSILIAIASSLIWYRIRQLGLKYRTKLEQKETEKLKAKYEKQLLELEAKALRAQMNPHFIFNCMNSIKALIQSSEEDKAVIYLTTFSKLIRTIFQNSDKRAISLYDEIETCRLYIELESMRFDNKFTYEFSVEASLDLKSVMVPALIIQPFIENAIWHGIVPKEEGGHLKVTVTNRDRSIFCNIDDTGIGREMSEQNKFKGDMSTHQSKGVRLTQARLDLNNLLTQRNTFLNIIDKKDDAGNATGTLVILEIRED